MSDYLGGVRVMDEVAETDELAALIGRLKVLIAQMETIDAEYQAHERPTNAVTAVSVAARLRALMWKYIP